MLDGDTHMRVPRVGGAVGGDVSDRFERPDERLSVMVERAPGRNPLSVGAELAVDDPFGSADFVGGGDEQVPALVGGHEQPVRGVLGHVG